MQVAYFTETLPGASGPYPRPDAIRLAAAVAWRHAPGRPPAARRGRGPGAWLRHLRHRLWLHFGPLGMDVHVRGADPPRAGGVVSSMSFGPGDESMMYYDEGNRAVRLLDRVYRLPPPGRTLVLLVDEGGRADAEPRITVRTVPAPVIPAPVIPGPPLPADLAPDADGPSYRRTYLIGGEHPAWKAALQGDPVVRAFLDRSAGA